MRKIIKISSILVILFALTIILNLNISNAASASISATSTSVTTGTSVTVTASVTAGAWNLKLSGANQSKGLVGQTSVADNQSASTSITFTPTTAGTYTFNLTGDMTDFNTDITEGVNKSITITATAPAPVDPTPVDPTPVTPTKSSNANLASLGITPSAYDFSGFTPSNTTYYVTIPYDVSTITVIARAQDSKAKVNGTGSRSINVGQTTLNITVTAEDGTTKRYTIIVTRKAEEKTTEEPAEVVEVAKSNNSALQSLAVLEGVLEPEFSPDITEYILNISQEIAKVNLTPAVADPKATVIVEGGQELQEGENTINIIVTAEDGTKTTYKVTVIKGKKELALQELKVGYMNEEGEFIELKLTPEFHEKIKEYFLGNIGYNIDKLLVQAIANFEDAEIEIIGNENLQEGENTIKIIVRRIINNENGTETGESEELQEVEEIEYILRVEKDIAPVVEPAGGFLQKISKWFKGIPGTFRENQNHIIIGSLGLCSIILLGLSIYMIVDYKRYKMLLSKLAELVKINASSQSVMETNTTTMDNNTKEESKSSESNNSNT